MGLSLNLDFCRLEVTDYKNNQLIRKKCVILNADLSLLLSHSCSEFVGRTNEKYDVEQWGNGVKR